MNKIKTTPAPLCIATRRNKLYLAIAAQCLFAAAVNAGPTGGQVVGGTGSIEQTGNQTTILQQSDALALDWDSFNVDADESVRFVQPSADSVALNRILSNDASNIFGNIEANGQIILMNPNGVFFGESATINVGSLVASGLAVDPDDFMNGQFTLDALADADGAVINQGIINAATGGSVVLVGKRVENQGLISAKLGTVSLAAGNQAVLTFDQQGMLGVRVSQAVLKDDIGVDSAVENSGEIRAEGGKVLLTASVSEDIFSQAVNSGNLTSKTSVVMHDDGSFTLGGGSNLVNTGTVDVSASVGAGEVVMLAENITQSGTVAADSDAGRAGHIELHARDTLMVEGTAKVSASSTLTGGDIKLLAERVGVVDQAEIHADGAAGGGQVLIGGDEQGLNSQIPKAEFIYLGADTEVSANATNVGDGGKLITFAENTARIFGRLQARGGDLGGDGGFIETSGKKGFELLSQPDASALVGKGGKWLIDPYDITIGSAGVDSNINLNGAIFTPTANSAYLDVITLRNALEAGLDITVTTAGGGNQAGDINFNDVVNYNNTGQNAQLTLIADGDIVINGGGTYAFGFPDPGAISVNLQALNGSISGNSANGFVLNGGSFTASANTIDFTSINIDTIQAVDPNPTIDGDVRAGSVTMNAIDSLIVGNIATSAGPSNDDSSISMSFFGGNYIGFLNDILTQAGDFSATTSLSGNIDFAPGIIIDTRWDGNNVTAKGSVIISSGGDIILPNISMNLNGVGTELRVTSEAGSVISDGSVQANGEVIINASQDIIFSAGSILDQLSTTGNLILAAGNNIDFNVSSTGYADTFYADPSSLTSLFFEAGSAIRSRSAIALGAGDIVFNGGYDSSKTGYLDFENLKQTGPGIYADTAILATTGNLYLRGSNVVALLTAGREVNSGFPEFNRLPSSLIIETAGHLDLDYLGYSVAGDIVFNAGPGFVDNQQNYVLANGQSISLQALEVIPGIKLFDGADAQYGLISQRRFNAQWGQALTYSNGGDITFNADKIDLAPHVVLDSSSPQGHGKITLLSAQDFIAPHFNFSNAVQIAGTNAPEIQLESTGGDVVWLGSMDYNNSNNLESESLKLIINAANNVILGADPGDLYYPVSTTTNPDGIPTWNIDDLAANVIDSDITTSESLALSVVAGGNIDHKWNLATNGGGYDLSGSDIYIRNGNPLDISGITAANLDIQTQADLSQSGAINVSGHTNIAASNGNYNINLNDGNNALNTLTLDVDYINGGAVTLEESDGLLVGDVYVNGTLSITTRAAGGSIVQTGDWIMAGSGSGFALNLSTDRIELGNAGSSVLDLSSNSLNITLAKNIVIDGEIQSGDILPSRLNIFGHGTDNVNFTLGPNATFNNINNTSFIQLGGGNNIADIYADIPFSLQMTNGDDLINLRADSINILNLSPGLGNDTINDYSAQNIDWSLMDGATGAGTRQFAGSTIDFIGVENILAGSGNDSLQLASSWQGQIDLGDGDDSVFQLTADQDATISGGVGVDSFYRIDSTAGSWVVSENGDVSVTNGNPTLSNLLNSSLNLFGFETLVGANDYVDEFVLLDVAGAGLTLFAGESTRTDTLILDYVTYFDLIGPMQLVYPVQSWTGIDQVWGNNDPDSTITISGGISGVDRNNWILADLLNFAIVDVDRNGQIARLQVRDFNVYKGEGADDFFNYLNVRVIDNKYILDGGAGNNTIQFNSTSGANWDLQSSNSTVDEIGTTTSLNFSNIQSVVGSDAIDSVIFNNGAVFNDIFTGAGDDILNFAGNNIVVSNLDAGAGNDTIIDSTVQNADWQILDGATGSISRQVGADSISAFGLESLIAGSGNDVLQLNDSWAGQIDLGDGDDSVYQNSADQTVTIIGGSGTDSFYRFDATEGLWTIAASGDVTVSNGNPDITNLLSSSISLVEFETLVGADDRVDGFVLSDATDAGLTLVGGDDNFSADYVDFSNAVGPILVSYPVQNWTGIDKVWANSDPSSSFTISGGVPGVDQNFWNLSSDSNIGYLTIGVGNVNETLQISGFSVYVGEGADDYFQLDLSRLTQAQSFVNAGGGNNTVQIISSAGLDWNLNSGVSQVDEVGTQRSISFSGDQIDIVGSDVVDNFIINDGADFVGVYGGAGDDNFYINDTQQISNLFGGDGVDFLVDQSAVSKLWSLDVFTFGFGSVQNRDLSNPKTDFAEIENIQMGDQFDVLEVNDGWSGLIDLGGGDDTVNLNVADISLPNLDAGPGNDIIVDKTSENAIWRILDGAAGAISRQGTVNLIDTVGFESILAGTGNDTLQFDSAWSGYVDLNDGDDAVYINASGIAASLASGAGQDVFYNYSDTAAESAGIRATFGSAADWNIAANGDVVVTDRNVAATSIQLQGFEEYHGAYDYTDQFYFAAAADLGFRLYGGNSLDDSLRQDFVSFEDVVGPLQIVDPFTNWFEMEQLWGNFATTSTLIASGGVSEQDANDWRISADALDFTQLSVTRNGVVASIATRGFVNFVGEDADDRFHFIGASSVKQALTLDGGAGINVIQVDSANGLDWDLQSITSAVAEVGTAMSLSFSNIQNIIGADSADTIVINANTNFSDVDTGAGDDSLIFSGTNSRLRNINMGAGSDLVKLDADSIVIGALVGGTDNVDDVIDGIIDTIDFSAIATTIEYNFVTKSNSTGSNYSGFENTLYNPNTGISVFSGDIDAVWQFTGSNSFTLTGNNDSESFTGAISVRGGAGVNEFIFADGATFDGSIQGAAVGDNRLVANNLLNAWTVDGANSGQVQNADGSVTTSFANISKLVGSGADDVFTLTGTGTISGSIDGGLGNDLLVQQAVSSTVTTNWILAAGNSSDTIELFNGIEVIQADQNQDLFNIIGLTDVRTIDGDSGAVNTILLNAGDATVNLGSGSQTVSVYGIGFANATDIQANAAGITLPNFSAAPEKNNVIVGADYDTTWLLTGNNSGLASFNDGNADVQYNFTGFNFIESGAGADEITGYRDATQATTNVTVEGLGNYFTTGLASDANRTRLGFRGIEVLNGTDGIDQFNIDIAAAQQSGITQINGGGDSFLDRLIVNSNSSDVDWVLLADQTNVSTNGYTLVAQDVNSLGFDSQTAINHRFDITSIDNEVVEISAAAAATPASASVTFANASPAAQLSVIEGTVEHVALTRTSGDLNFNDIDLFIGGSVGGQITAANQTNNWDITSSQVALNNLYTFENFNVLVGGSANDVFVVNAMPAALSLAGGVGVNQITGPAQDNVWTVSGANAGTLNSAIQFSAIQNLVGGDLIDVVTIATGAQIGTLDLGSGDDTVDLLGVNASASSILMGLGADKVVLADGSFVNGVIDGGDDSLETAGVIDILDLSAVTTAEELNFSTGQSTLNIQSSGFEQTPRNPLAGFTLFSGDGDFTWNFEGDNSLTISDGNRSVNYTDVSIVRGGVGNHDFILTDGARYQGQIRGDANGSNTLYANTLIDTWLINGINSGSASGENGALQIVFSNIANLVGSAANEVFTVATAGQIGSISAMGGDDQLLLNGNVLVGSFNGGVGTDTILGADQNNVWDLSDNDLNGMSFAEVEVLVGGALVDTFQLLDLSNTAIAIDGGAGQDSLLGPDADNTWNLQNSTLNDSVTFSNIEVLDGTFGTSQDTLVGANQDASWLVDSDYAGTVSSGNQSIQFKGMEFLQGGDLNDDFTLAANVTAGIIRGGAGQDLITLANNVTVSGIDGGAGDDTVVVAQGLQVLVGGLVDGGVDGSDTLDVQDYGLTVTGAELQTLIGFNFVNFLDVLNSVPAGELYGSNDTNYWFITGQNSGVLRSVSVDGTQESNFSDIHTLRGGKGADYFIFADDGAAITTLIDGGSGSNTLALTWDDSGNSLVQNLINTWLFDGVNSGSLANSSNQAGNIFTNIAAVIGGGSQDLMSVKGSGDVASISGGAGLDRLEVDIDENNVWQIGSAQGTVNGTLTFADIEQLLGCGCPETFHLLSPDTVVQQIDGAGGRDTINIGYADRATVDLANQSVGSVKYFNFERLLGNNGGHVIQGAHVDTNWTLTGNNQGSIQYLLTPTSNPVNIDFTGFGQLQGGSEVDQFTLQDGAQLSSGLAGGGGQDRLVNAATGVATWTVNALDAGSWNSQVNFSDVEQVQGGAGQDNFAIDAGAGMSGGVDGGDGIDRFQQLGNANQWLVSVDTSGVNPIIGGQVGQTQFSGFEQWLGGGSDDRLTASDTDNTWSLGDSLSNTHLDINNSAGQRIQFSGMRYIQGGAADDQFNVVNATALPALIAGGAGNDQVNLQTLAADLAVALEVGALPAATLGLTIESVETLRGNGQQVTTLYGAGDQSYTWIIDGVSSGRLSGGADQGTQLEFSDISAIRGGANDDIFQVLSGITNISVDGGDQVSADFIDYSQVNGNLQINLAQALTGQSGQIAGVEGIRGNNGGVGSLNNAELIAADGNNLWTIADLDGAGLADGINDGEVNDGQTSVRFLDFNILTGGAGDDTFNQQGGIVIGSLLGGAGDDQLNVSVAGVNRGTHFDGGAGNNSLTLSGAAVSTSVQHTSTAQGGQFQYQDLDTDYTLSYLNVANINENTQAQTLTLLGSNAVDNIALINGGFSVNGGATVRYDNKQDLLVNAAANDTIQIADNLVISNRLTLSGATVTTVDSANTSISANQLLLNNTGDVGSVNGRIRTNITDLLVRNALGDLALQEQNGLNIAEFLSTGETDLLLVNGALTNSAAVTAADDFSVITEAGNIRLLGANQISGDVRFNVNGDIQWENASNINIAALSANNINFVSQRGLTADGIVNVSGDTLLQATNDISMENPLNDFNQVNITDARNVSLVDQNALQLIAANTRGYLWLDALGIQVDGDIVADAIRLNANSGSALLGGNLNTAGGGDIDIDANLIVQDGSIVSGRSTTLNSTTSITQNGSIQSGGDVTASAANGNVIVAEGTGIRGNTVTISASGNLQVQDVDAESVSLVGGELVVTGGSLHASRGDINVVSGNYSMSVNSVLEAEFGAIRIKATDSIETSATVRGTEVVIEANQITLGGNVTATQGQVNVDGGSKVDVNQNITASSGVTIAAASGSVNQTGTITSNNGSVNLTAGGNGDVVMGASSKIDLNQGNVTISAGRDVIIADVVASGTVNVNATTGGLIDANGSEANVSAGKFVTAIATGVGDGDAIETQVGGIDAVTQSGNVEIRNQGNLQVSKLQTDNGNISLVNDGDVVLNGPAVSAKNTTGDSEVVLALNKGDLSQSGDTSVPAVTSDNVSLFAEQGTVGDSKGIRIDTDNLQVNALAQGGELFLNPGVETKLHFSASFKFEDQILTVEPLEDLNPAVFANVKSYFYNDISLLLPVDQRFDEDEEEQEVFENQAAE